MSYGSFFPACLHYMFYKFPEMILIVFIITKHLKDLGGGGSSAILLHILYKLYRNFIDLADFEITKNSMKVLKVRGL